MDRILFLIKNGIGFGHVRRAILVAEAIHRLVPSAEITIICQANSLKLFRNVPFRVINFPLLDRLPNNSTERAFVELLTEVITQLAPSIVIEDTYPDWRYLSMPPIQNIPKVLLIRRLDRYGFEWFRKEGYFSRYDRIVIGQHQGDFLLADHSPKSKLLIEFSGRFTFSGPIFRYPTREELHRAANLYRPDLNPLVVVNAGAGGDHFNDAYCERLFISMSRVATRFELEERAARFIFVLGPYYGGVEPPPQANVTVVKFEPDFTALLHLARVVVVRPGHNTVYEALSGTAEVIVVPNISYLEDQHSFSDYLRKQYGVAIADHEDTLGLFHLTDQLLHNPGRTHLKVPTPGQDSAAQAIIKEIDYDTKLSHQLRNVSSVRAFLLVADTSIECTGKTMTPLQRSCGGPVYFVSKDSSERNIPDLDALHHTSPSVGTSDLFSPAVLLRSISTRSLTPHVLREGGVKVILYTNRCEFGMTAEDWLQHHDITQYGMLQCKLFHFYALPNGLRQFAYVMSKLLPTSGILPLFVDLSLISNESQLTEFFKTLTDWITECGVSLMTLDEFVQETAFSNLT